VLPIMGHSIDTAGPQQTLRFMTALPSVLVVSIRAARTVPAQPSLRQHALISSVEGFEASIASIVTSR
jgi:hypothetical protein